MRDVISMIMLHKTITPPNNSLLIISIYSFDEISYHMERPVWQGTARGLQLMVNKEALSLTGHKEVSSANNHGSLE